MLQTLRLDPTVVEYEIKAVNLEGEGYLKELEPYQSVYQTAVDYSPWLKSANLGIGINERDLEISKAGRIPRIYAQGGIGTRFSSNGSLKVKCLPAMIRRNCAAASGPGKAPGTRKAAAQCRKQHQFVRCVSPLWVVSGRSRPISDRPLSANSGHEVASPILLTMVQNQRNLGSRGRVKTPGSARSAGIVQVPSVFG